VPREFMPGKAPRLSPMTALESTAAAWPFGRSPIGLIPPAPRLPLIPAPRLVPRPSKLETPLLTVPARWTFDAIALLSAAEVIGAEEIESAVIALAKPVEPTEVEAEEGGSDALAPAAGTVAPPFASAGHSHELVPVWLL